MDAGDEDAGAPVSTGILAPPAPASAGTLFGDADRLGRAERYVALLADTGITHGLIGPREVPRLWQRHVLNCAVLGDVIPADVRVVDVGSGAGLPGLVLAVARPDLDVHLVDPLLRRTAWLAEAVRELDLENVTIHRARAEELTGSLDAPVVTARAVAPLGKLARWCLPLVQPQGRLLALKGRSAESEVERDRDEVERAGGHVTGVRHLGAGVLEDTTAVVEVVPVAGRRPAPPAGGGNGRARKRARRPRVS